MSDNINIFTPSDDSGIELPLSDERVAAGFPSPAEDYASLNLDLNRELIKNPASTFYARVSGLSMIDEGINDGDLLVIDKSIEPYDGCLLYVTLTASSPSNVSRSTRTMDCSFPQTKNSSQ